MITLRENFLQIVIENIQKSQIFKIINNSKKFINKNYND